MIVPGVIIDVANFFRVAISGFGLRFRGSTSGQVGLKPPAIAGSTDYTLPGVAPTSDNVLLTSDVSGVMTWASIANIDCSSLPTTDPLINGLLYREPTTNYIVMSTGVSSYSPSYDFSDARNSMYVAIL